MTKRLRYHFEKRGPVGFHVGTYIRFQLDLQLCKGMMSQNLEKFNHNYLHS